MAKLYGSLLSLVPPSCMVAPNREFVNINFITNNSTMSHSMDSNTVSEDINMDLLRSRSNLSSPNLSRESSSHLDLSSVPYVRMEIQNNDPFWADQVDSPQDFQLLYTTPKEGESNIQKKADIPGNMPSPHVEDVNNNKSQPQSI